MGKGQAWRRPLAGLNCCGAGGRDRAINMLCNAIMRGARARNVPGPSQGNSLVVRVFPHLRTFWTLLLPYLRSAVLYVYTVL